MNRGVLGDYPGLTEDKLDSVSATFVEAVLTVRARSRALITIRNRASGASPTVRRNAAQTRRIQMAVYNGTISSTATTTESGVAAFGSSAKAAIVATSAAGTSLPAVQGYGSQGSALYGYTTKSFYGALTAVNGAANGYGVHGEAHSEGGCGVRGVGDGSYSTGVLGKSQLGTGVNGETSGALGIGVMGRALNTTGYAVYGFASAPSNPNCWAGYFSGRVYVSGALTKAGGGFLIDHPNDAENKTLEHSFVESPERKTIYDGVATADSNGESVVRLPAYFEALNSDFRYQLTAVGGPASLYVKQELRDGHFVVAGAPPGQRFSWMVTGIRKDAWAVANPLTVEAEKPAEERGTFLNPEARGLPFGKSVELTRNPGLARR